MNVGCSYECLNVVNLENIVSSLILTEQKQLGWLEKKLKKTDRLGGRNEGGWFREKAEQNERAWKIDKTGWLEQKKRPREPGKLEGMDGAGQSMKQVGEIKAE